MSESITNNTQTSFSNKTQNTSSTILAIDPGTRELGFAVLAGEELLYYGVKTVTNRKSPSQVLEIVSGFIKKLIESYNPSILAIEKMFVTQKNSALLAVVAEQVKALAREYGLLIFEYAPSSLRKRLCQTGRATKREAARILSLRYSELARYYNRTRMWEQDYYANLFDAIAVGVTCRQDFKQQGETAQSLTNY